MTKGKAIASTSVLVFFILVGFAVAYPGWRWINWDKEKVETIKGKIISNWPCVVARVDGQEYIIHVGPLWYWQDKEVKFQKSADIEVTGIVVDIVGVKHIFPQTLRVDGKELKITDENGMPLWAGYRFARGFRKLGPGMCSWNGPGMHGWRGHRW